ncbi:Cell death regulator [Triplophysa tibetana]|uniref:Cell death regulator n=1 Tax=Triplophysa tibetana TaxID=1572043 RepID=A0A5A9NEZ4_9TELE|nr:Cell death regulator [Triplophysa tibetana]
MDNRPSRGRGGHWKRGGGGGGVGSDGVGSDTGSSGEQRGRGRGGHHRGRGKRDHRRGQYHGPPADFRRNQDEDLADENKPAEEEIDPIFPRRKLESNWDRYEESERKETNEDVPTKRGTDYHVLLSSAGHFSFRTPLPLFLDSSPVVLALTPAGPFSKITAPRGTDSDGSSGGHHGLLNHLQVFSRGACSRIQHSIEKQHHSPALAGSHVGCDSYTQFRFSDEKDWEMDSLAINQIPGLFIDLPALSQKLEKLPLHTRLNLDAEFNPVTPVQLPTMKMPHRTDSATAGSLKTPQVGGISGLDINCTVKSFPVTTPSPPVSTTIQPPKDDVDRELDLLLSLQNPITELASVESNTVMDETPNNPVTETVSVKEEKKEEKGDKKDTKLEVEKEPNSAKPELTEKDLEDWLDSMIS